MKKTTLVISSLIMLCTISSCSKKGDTGPAGPVGPAGPSFTGAINGHVIIYDQYGSRVLNWPNSVQLTLKGGKSTTADSTGYFVFGNVTTGSYTITAAGEGLGGTLVKNIPFLSDTFNTDIALTRKPDFNLAGFTAYHNTGSQFDSLVFAVPADTKARNLIVFVNNKRSVSNDPNNYLLAYVKAIPASSWVGNVNVMLRIPASDLNNANIYYGEQIYFAACSYVVNDVSLYEDPTTGKQVYNAVGTALVDSTIAP